MGNISEGRLVPDKLKFLSKSHSEFPDLLLKPRDLLFNRTNSAELVGKTAVYRGTPEPCSFASYLIRVRLKHYSPDFLSYYVNSVYGRQWVASVVSQHVGQANVNGAKLKALAIPNPPFEQQQRIVVEVERRLSMVEELQALVDTNMQRASRLLESIVQAVFNCRLG
jgi:type I restriction enzyme, S subunit